MFHACTLSPRGYVHVLGFQLDMHGCKYLHLYGINNETRMYIMQWMDNFITFVGSGYLIDMLIA